MRFIDKKIKILVMTAILIMATSVPAFSQYFSLGADPTNVKWREIKGEHYDVIYPEQNDSLARRYLYLFEAARDRNMAGAHIEPQHVPLILHPYDVRPKSTVAWAPKRVDIFTTPGYQPYYPQNWDQQIALHEGRHLTQMSHYLQGFYKVMSYIGGEQAIVIGVGLNPRGSALEGDAVMNETEFSNSGRGRSGDFLMYYRAAFHAQDFRRETDWRFGSYTRYAPDKQSYGYMLNYMGRYMSGNYYTSGDIMQQYCWWWWRILDVSRYAYRYATGMTQKEIWNNGQGLLYNWWEEDFAKRAPYSHVDTLTSERNRQYIEYTNTLPNGEGGAFATKNGKHQASHLVEIDSLGIEHYRKTFSPTTSKVVTDGTGHYYFSEIIPDPRWELKSFSILREYDKATNRYRNITRRTRYFNPMLSPDGKNLVAVENMPESGSDSKIVVVDKQTGKTLQTIAGPKGWHITEVAQYQDKYYALTIIDDGIGISRYCDGEWKIVVEPQPSLMRDFSITESGDLLFVSDLNGVNNAYLVKLHEGSDYELLQLTSAQFGTLRPTIVGDEMYFSDYEHRGYNPVKTPLDSLFYRPVTFQDKYVDRIIDSVARQSARMSPKWTEEQDSILLAQVDSLPSKKYNKLFHGFHIHSWLPLYANIDKIMALSLEDITTVASLGAMVMSQNELGTLESILGYSYRKGFHAGHLKLTYSGLYPVFETSLDVNERKRTFTTFDVDPGGSIEPGSYLPIKYTVDTTSAAAVDFKTRVYLPLNFSRSGWDVGVVPDVEYAISNDKVGTYGEPLRNSQSLMLKLVYYQLLAEPTARLTPRFGWGLNFNYMTSLGRHDNLGSLLYSNLYGYFPGINDVQGLKLSWSWQKQMHDYPYAYIKNLASCARGYDTPILTDFHKFTLDYSIPFYGCFDGLTTFFFYLQRVILIPFADLAINTSEIAISKKGQILEKGDIIQYSAGSKLMVDLHLFRFGFSLKFGLQYAYTGENRNTFKFVLSTGL